MAFPSVEVAKMKFGAYGAVNWAPMVLFVSEFLFSKETWSLCFRLTSTEAYFVSEALYCPTEELENSREVTLQVATVGAYLVSPDKVNTYIVCTLFLLTL
jgi:hypothetical protein